MAERIGTGKWAEAGVPHKGWTCVGIEDLGEPSFTCEMCEVMTIRYVHTMEHPDYPDGLDCGCICAGHMEQDVVGARQREAAFKASRHRRARWLKRRWHSSWNGNEYVNTDGFNVVIYRRGPIWGGRVLHRDTGRERASKLPYATSDHAKLAAFDAMLGMKRHLEDDET